MKETLQETLKSKTTLKWYDKKMNKTLKYKVTVKTNRDSVLIKVHKYCGRPFN